MKILIVDDSVEWIKFHTNLLNRLLSDISYEIHSELSAKSGINNILNNSNSPYNLIISDLEMEEIQGESYAGMWFVRNILKRDDCKNSKIIIISGSYDIDKIAAKLNVDFIPKNMLYNNPLLLKYKLESAKDT